MEALPGRVMAIDGEPARLLVRLVALAALAIQLVTSLAAAQPAGAVAPGDPHFLRTWERVDRPVAELLEGRSWLWGPYGNTEVITEEYTEGPSGMREVQYYDKSRMEITDPNADPDSVWYVTNGLLVVELMTGQMQVGHNDFLVRSPAEINVAGDAGDPNGVTYQTFAMLRDLPPLTDGATIAQIVDRDGNVTEAAALADYGVTAAHHVQVPGIDHQVAAPFWNFMNSTGLIYNPQQGFVEGDLFLSPFYATGYPLTEAYFVEALVGGTPKIVLAQCFERRCLTYTPDNEPGWQVEAGNVGLHYFDWRYNTPDPEPPVPAGSTLRINEVLFMPGDDEPLAWVELHNYGTTPVYTAGWHLASGDASQPVSLPNWALSPGSYLTVYFGTGQSNHDGTDGSAEFYPGSSYEGYFNSFDIGLYEGPAVRADTIVDFVAWTYLDAYEGGDVHDDAVEAEIWTADTAYDAYGGVDPATVDPHERIHFVGPDESIGRDADGTDTNSPNDWAAYGGADSFEPTPGARNHSSLLAAFDAAFNEPEGAHALNQAPTLPQPQKAWTIMVYNDAREGDVGVAADLKRELALMGAVGSNDDVNIVVRMHHPGGVATTSYVQPGMPALLQRDVNINPGTSQALSGFISYTKTNFPAEKYAIVFGSHGDGWKALMVQGPGDDFLRMAELSAGLAALGQPFDVVKFDACLMAQVEVAHQIQPQARTMVASEQISFGGFPWDEFLNELQADPSVSGGTLADRLAQHHALAYERDLARIPDNPHTGALQKTLRAYTWASVDTATVSAQLVPAVSAFATALIGDVEEIETHDFRDDNHQLIIKHEARELVMEYYDSNYIDLQRFAELVEMTLLEASDFAPPVIAGVEAAVRWESHGPTMAYEQSHGLSIYFPRALLNPNSHSGGCLPATPVCGSARAFDDPLFDPALPGRTHLYKRDADIKLPSLVGSPHAMLDDGGFSFPNDAAWDEFLQRYYKPVADACIRLGGNCVPEATLEVGQSVILSGSGSSDSDGILGPLDDEPGTSFDYFWDLHTNQDNPNPLPNYRPGVMFFSCVDAEDRSEDCDRDEVDEADDDADRVGTLVLYPCFAPGDFPVRLMVWDEHHRHSRESHEDVNHNQGRHWLHFNVDDAWVLIHCVESDEPVEPIKRSNKEQVVPGEGFEYVIELPAGAGEEGSASIFDELPELVEFGEIVDCGAGECGYDEALHAVYMEGGTLDPEQPLILRFSVFVVEDLPPSFPPEIINCATVNVGAIEHEACASTLLVVEEGPPSTGMEASNRPQ